MAGDEDQRGLVGGADRFGVGRDGHEPRLVLLVGLDVPGQDLQAVHGGGPLRRHRGLAHEPALRDALRGAGGVVDGDQLHVELGQVLVALREGLRVRGHDADVLERGARQREQRVVHRHDHLAHDVRVAPRQQVVRFVDRAGQRILQRHDGPVDRSAGHGVEHGSHRSVRLRLHVREQHVDGEL